MDTELIIHNEETNDGTQIHLYYNYHTGTWVVYNNSADIIKPHLKMYRLEALSGYSNELHLPCIVLSNKIVTILRNSFTIITETDTYLQLLFPENNSIEQPVYHELNPQDSLVSDHMSKLACSCKRFLDIIGASLLILLLAPLFLICYIMVRKEDRGPAIFKQERIGYNGEPFNIYKFRSMRLDAERFGPQLSHNNGKNDFRLTNTGRYLRLHHLDELPQLWNVLRGEMSFVGPRPERMFFIKQILEYDKRYTYLYQIRPGLTSLATLYNGYTDTMEKMLQRLDYDLYYLSHRSITLDFKIILITFYNLMFKKRA